MASVIKNGFQYVRSTRQCTSTMLSSFWKTTSPTLIVRENFRTFSKYSRKGSIDAVGEYSRKDEAKNKKKELVTPWCRHVVSGWDLLRTPRYNKGLAFSDAEREHLHLRGILPPVQIGQEQQMERVMRNVQSIENPLDKYTYLMALKERNHVLFHRALHDYVEELLPIYGNPTVGLACQKYGTIFRRPSGLFLSVEDKGHIEAIMNNWPETNVKLIVVTDGERVLGLGDLGMQGMSIVQSKVAWAVAAGGMKPEECLPIILDVGTDNTSLMEDKFYFGLKHPRIRAEEYDDLVDEFVECATRKFGADVQLHFSDFDYVNAGRLLLRHRGQASCYNDDLQGMAAVTLAGLMTHIGEEALGRQRFLLVGAGEAGICIADLLTFAIARHQQISIPEAREAIWLFDSEGMVVRERNEQLQYHKLPYVRNHPLCSSLVEAIHSIKPAVMIGTSTTMYTKGGSFTKEVCEAMVAVNSDGAKMPPVIFALSGRFNAPGKESDDKQECSAQNAYDWTNGNLVFVGGAPEPPVTTPDGSVHTIRSAHTLYIYPGVALGLKLAGAVEVNDDMILAAAQVLSKQATNEDKKVGALYPPLSKIREVSVVVAAAVAAKAYELGCARVLPRPRNLHKAAEKAMYKLDYDTYR